VPGYKPRERDDEGRKYCRMGDHWLPEEDFGVAGWTSDGLRSTCRACSRPARRRASRRAQLKALYGLTEEAYCAMLLAQGGSCAICGTDDPGGNGAPSMHVDHCHRTGRVRGLLCSRCNLAIGNLEDSPDLLRIAADYLERSMCQ
jgi:hypothetical protein